MRLATEVLIEANPAFKKAVIEGTLLDHLAERFYAESVEHDLTSPLNVAYWRTRIEQAYARAELFIQVRREIMRGEV